MDDYEPDTDAVEEQLFATYLLQCEHEGFNPSLSDYEVWKEENFD